MRVLFLSHLVPYPLDTGAKIRAYFVLKHLAEAGHETTLCAFRRPVDSREHIDHLRAYCTEVHTVPIKRSRVRDAVSLVRSSMARTPLVMDRDRSGEMRSRVASLVARGPGFDVIHADQLAMAPYAVAAKREHGAADAPAAVLDQHNAVFNVVRRLADHENRVLWRRLLTWEADKLARYEASICGQFDHIVWVAEHDRAALAGLPPSASRSKGDRGSPILSEVPATVIPIAVDPTADDRIHRSKNGRRVVFLGGLNWPPNERGIFRFLEHGWPQIRKASPEACLTVIGRNPPRWLLTRNRHRSDLDVTDYVLDLRPYLKNAAVLVVPLDAGGGMRVKILSAWCWGVPVVSTTIGAEGLRARDGENLLIADSVDTLSSCVVKLLQDPTRGERLAQAGRKTVEKHYNWRVTYSAWDSVYAQLARGAGQVR